MQYVRQLDSVKGVQEEVAAKSKRNLKRSSSLADTRAASKRVTRVSNRNKAAEDAESDRNAPRRKTGEERNIEDLVEGKDLQFAKG